MLTAEGAIASHGRTRNLTLWGPSTDGTVHWRNPWSNPPVVSHWLLKRYGAPVERADDTKQWWFWTRGLMQVRRWHKIWPRRKPFPRFFNGFTSLKCCHRSKILFSGATVLSERSPPVVLAEFPRQAGWKFPLHTGYSTPLVLGWRRSRLPEIPFSSSRSFAPLDVPGSNGLQLVSSLRIWNLPSSKEHVLEPCSLPILTKKLGYRFVQNKPNYQNPIFP